MSIAIRARHYSPRTEKAYVGWIHRFVVFHGKRHPDQMGAPEVARYGLEDVPRAKRPVHVPLVLTREEVQAVLARLRGATWLMGALMYGAGLRVLECCRLRVKDLDFARGELTVRAGKGRKDRVTVLPCRLIPLLEVHLERVRRGGQGVRSPFEALK